MHRTRSDVSCDCILAGEAWAACEAYNSKGTAIDSVYVRAKAKQTPIDIHTWNGKYRQSTSKLTSSAVMLAESAASVVGCDEVGECCLVTLNIGVQSWRKARGMCKVITSGYVVQHLVLQDQGWSYLHCSYQRHTLVICSVFAVCPAVFSPVDARSWRSTQSA